MRVTISDLMKKADSSKLNCYTNATSNVMVQHTKITDCSCNSPRSSCSFNAWLLKLTWMSPSQSPGGRKEHEAVSSALSVSYACTCSIRAPANRK